MRGIKILRLTTFRWQTGKLYWAELDKLNPQYEGFQRKTRRIIPMAVLYPTEAN